MRRAWIALTAAALLTTGCGGKGRTGTETTAPTERSTRTTTSTTSSTDCITRGIDPTEMREGTCTHDGITWVIVDENHTVKLNTLWATLAGVKTTKVLAAGAATATASGDFVVASVTLTNKLASPQRFDQAGTQQAGLILDGAVFKEAVGAERRADSNSCLQRDGTPIQVRKSETCDVVFDVPTGAAAELGKHGSGDLYLVNFGSDLAGGAPPRTIGQIRLYR